MKHLYLKDRYIFPNYATKIIHFIDIHKKKNTKKTKKKSTSYITKKHIKSLCPKSSSGESFYQIFIKVPKIRFFLLQMA